MYHCVMEDATCWCIIYAVYVEVFIHDHMFIYILSHFLNLGNTSTSVQTNTTTSTVSDLHNLKYIYIYIYIYILEKYWKNFFGTCMKFFLIWLKSQQGNGTTLRLQQWFPLHWTFPNIEIYFKCTLIWIRRRGVGGNVWPANPHLFRILWKMATSLESVY